MNASKIALGFAALAIALSTGCSGTPFSGSSGIDAGRSLSRSTTTEIDTTTTVVDGPAFTKADRALLARLRTTVYGGKKTVGLVRRVDYLEYRTGHKADLDALAEMDARTKLAQIEARRATKAPKLAQNDGGTVNVLVRTPADATVEKR